MNQAELRDVTKSYIPVAVMGGLLLLAFTVGSIYQNIASAPAQVASRVDTLETQYKQDMAKVSETISRLASSVDELRKAITDPLSSRLPSDLVRTSDLRVFCLEMQVKNPTVSLTCPDTD